MKRFLSMLLLVAAATVAAENKPNDVVATINGEAVTWHQLDVMYAQLSPQLRDNYDRAGGKRAFLNNYIERRLIVQEALKQNLDKTEDAKAEIAAARENVLFNRYVRTFIAPSVVSEALVKAHYDANKEQFRLPEQMHAAHIVVTPQAGGVTNATGSDAATDDAALAKITRLMTQINQGDLTFADAARQYSEDVAAPEGGDLGWFAAGSMVPEFDQAALKLSKGQMSGIVRSSYGYHLIQMIDKTPSRIAPFKEVENDVRESLYAEKAGEIMAEVTRNTNALRRESQINVDLPE